jgi:PAS domain S-box-containing protein
MAATKTNPPAILVVDDETDISLALGDLLGSEGYQVHAVETGNEALRRVSPAHPYSAVILDLGLPDIDGLTVLQRLYTLDETLPVIILTAHGDQKEKIATLQHHAFAHLIKPYDKQEVIEMVHRAVAVKHLTLKAAEVEQALTSSEAQRQLEQQRTQILLSESEQRLHLALKAGSMGIWDWHIPTNHIIWSDEVAGLFGLPPGTFDGTYRGYANCIHPEDRSMLEETIRSTLEHDTPYEIEHRVMWPTGEVRWLACKGQVVKDQEGRPQRMLGTVQDITTRKQAEVKLRDSQMFLTSIVENLPHMIFVKDANDLRFILFNKAGEELLGYSLASLIGKTDYDFFPTSEADFFTGKDREVLSGRQPLDIPEEVIQTRTRGPRYLHTKKIPLLDAHGEPLFLLGISEDITERKQADLERDERELLLRLMFETGAGCVKRVAADGTLLHMNPAGLEVIEAEQATEALGRSVFDLIIPEHRAAFQQMHENVIQGRKQTLQFQVQGFKGSRRWLETYAVPFRNPLTKEVEHLAISHDITERKEAEDVIRKGERKFRAIYEQAPTGIAILDSLCGRFTQINKKYCDMVGYSHEEMLERTFQDITHPDDLQADLNQMQQLLAGQINSFQMEKRYIRKNGEIIWVHLTCVPLWLETTDPRLHIAMVEDITHRKQGETALRESEEWFRLLTEAIPQQVWTAQPDGSLNYVNQRVIEYFGCPFEGMIGHGWQRFLHPDDLPECLECWAKARETNQPYEIEFRLLREKDHSFRWHLGCALPIFNQEGQVVKWFGTNTDITQLKQLENQVRQSQKMEAIGTLAGGIAHDFNNILMGIVGYTELAKQKAGGNEVVKRNLNEVLVAGQRAKELVQQILAFSRQTEQERQPLELQLVVKEVCKFLRATLPATIEIRQNFTEAPTIILGDPIQMHQVVMNLCANAEHAMRESGGLLELTVDHVAGEPDGVGAHPDLKGGSYIRLTVRDTGAGMTPDVVQRIFDPFFTTKGIGEGTGMGLAVVHGIVIGHGGVIHVESERGKGTTFSIYFPEMEASSIQGEDDLLQQEIFMGRGRILFVEDEEPLARLGEEAMKELGYEVLVRTSSVDALEVFRADPFRFDVVVTDQTMPNMTGEVLARELLQLRPDVPIILCTGFSHAITPEQAKAIGIRAYLLKPLLIKDLGLALREVLQS